MSEADKFKIEKRGDEWCAVSEDGERSFGCYPTEDEAKERLRQVEAAKAAKSSQDFETLLHYQEQPMVTSEVDGHTHTIMPWANETNTVNGHNHPIRRDEYGSPFQVLEADGHTHEIDGEIEMSVFAEKDGNILKDIEIFRTGEWNGRKFSEQDLDDIVEAFDKVGYRVPVKLGHDEQEGGRAWGWVENLRKIGKKLVADLVDISDNVFATIKDHGYDAVSSEIYLNLKRDGETFRRALKAVALLGAEPPAVSDLKPLRESLSALSYEGVVQLKLDEEQMSEKSKDQGKDGNEPNKPDEAELEDLRQKAAKADELEAEITRLKQANKNASESTVRLQELQDEIEELKQKNAKDAEKRRLESIDRRVASFSMPAFRPHFRALLDLATKAETQVAFKVDDEDKEVDAETVVEDLMRRIDKHSQKLFSQQGVIDGDMRRSDKQSAVDPGDELARLAQAHMTQHNTDDFSAAFHAVLEDPENADLKRRYINRE